MSKVAVLFDIYVPRGGGGDGGAAAAVVEGSEMKITAATGGLEKRPRKFQKEFVDVIIEISTTRLQGPEIAMRLRGCVYGLDSKSG